MFMKKFYLCRRRLDRPRPHFPRRRRGHRPPSTMPPHGSAKKKKKGRDGTGKKKSRRAPIMTTAAHRPASAAGARWRISSIPATSTSPWIAWRKD